MTVSALILLASLVVLLMCSAFFSSAETVYFSLNPLQVRRVVQRKPEAGPRIQAIVGTPTRLLSSVLIGNTIINVAASTVGYNLAALYVPAHSEVVAIPAMTLLLVVFGEIGPKRIGLFFAESLAIVYAPAIETVMRLTAPVRSALENITRRFEPVFRPRGRTLSEDEFETVLDISGEEGILNADELAMVKAIFNLEDMKASDVMTPRVDLIGIDLNEDTSNAVEIARAARLNYLVLYRDQFDDIEGFLDVRRFLLDPEHRIGHATLPPFYVAESTPLTILLNRFQKERRRVAVVVDEYGGTAGVMTRGDILEEITGEIYNELSKPQPLIQNAGPHRWLVDANISLEELNRKLLMNLEAEGADRLSGWIAAMAGHLPQQDDTIEAQGCRVRVLQTVRQRVTLAQIEKTERSA